MGFKRFLFVLALSLSALWGQWADGQLGFWTVAVPTACLLAFVLGNIIHELAGDYLERRRMRATEREWDSGKIRQRMDGVA